MDLFCVLFLIVGCVQDTKLVTVHGSNNDRVCLLFPLWLDLSVLRDVDMLAVTVHGDNSDCLFFVFGPWAIELGPMESGFMFDTHGWVKMPWMVHLHRGLAQQRNTLCCHCPSLDKYVAVHIPKHYYLPQIAQENYKHSFASTESLLLYILHWLQP